MIDPGARVGVRLLRSDDGECRVVRVVVVVVGVVETGAGVCCLSWW